MLAGPLLLIFLLSTSIPILFYYWLNTPYIFDVPQKFSETQSANEHPSEIGVFKIEIDENRIFDHKHKLEVTRLPSTSNEFWKNLTKVMIDFDWQQHERFLNTFKQYKTTIEDLDVHFVRAAIAAPKGSQVVPLVLLHGFPGAYWDFFKIIPILSNPRRFNYDFGVHKPLLFDVIVPSLPNFIFSDKSDNSEFSPLDCARILIRLMENLGVEKYFIHGTEKLGSDIATIMAVMDSKVWGVHLSNPFVPLFFDVKTTLKYLRPTEGTSLWDYYSKPQFRPTENSNFIATAINDSPIAHCALIMQYWEIGSTSKQLNEQFTLDELATICYLYWLTDSLPSGLTVMNNGEKIEQRFQLAKPTAILKTAYAPWQSSDDILRHQFLNITRITKLEKGGLFHSLQTSEELAADIFRFVEVTIL